MKGIILAAGRGRRMGEATSEKPKCLLEIKGQSLLDMQLMALKSAGIAEIVVVTGYRSELFRKKIYTVYNDLWSETNMYSSLTKASSWLYSDNCIVSYSDIFYSKDAVTSLVNSNSDIAVTYDPNWLGLWQRRFTDPMQDAETFLLDEQSLLVEIGKEPQSINEIQGQYMGLLYFSPQGWKIIKNLRKNLDFKKRNEMQMTQMLSQIAKNQSFIIRAIPYYGKWGEIDSENDIKVFENQ